MESWQTKLTLRELAGRWRKDEGQLLAMAADNRLRLSLRAGLVLIEDNGKTHPGFLGIHQEEAEQFRQGYEAELLDENRQKNQPLQICDYVGPGGRLFKYEDATTCYRSDLVVLKEEIERVEKLYTELRPADLIFSTRGNHREVARMEFPVDVPEWAGRKLKEASELTGETEDNLLRQAIKGDLPLWVWFPYPGADPKDVLFNRVKMLPYHGWAKIEPDAIPRFINGEAISSFELRLFDRKKGTLNCAAFYHPEVNTTTNKFHLNQIRVMPADLERLTTTTEKAQTGGNQKEATKGKGGGRPPHPFKEAMKAAYLYFLETGQTEILRESEYQGFLRALRRLLDAKDIEFGDKEIKKYPGPDSTDHAGNQDKEFRDKEIKKYLSVRIEKVEIGRKPFIRTYPRPSSSGKGKSQKPVPAKTYYQKEISTELSELRKDNPLPS